MQRLVFDFPGSRRAYRDPIAIHSAVTTDEVAPALEAADAAVRAGRHVAGYVAYEAAPAFEPGMAVRPGSRMPLVWLGEFERADPAGSGDRPGPSGYGQGHGQGQGQGQDPGHDEHWELDLTGAAHARAVATVREAIAAGDTYQVNLTARFRARLRLACRPPRAPGTGDTATPDAAKALFHRLRRAQGAGYHAFLDLGRHAIASASPELFFRTRGRAIETRPMKGTRPRGRWPAEDAALRAELASSAKDRAENLMIVDLLRNDIGRVAVPGSVAVPALQEVERYRTVWQMTSTITGRLRDDVGLVDLFRALFPCGSVTGAPKISTMAVIAGLEASPREVYCGAIGFIEPGGDATFSVPIRTAWIDRETGMAEYGAGGGVVWDSTPDAEYRELSAKAAVLRERWPDFELIETLRLDGRTFVRLDRHLARLRDSAEYFGFPFPDDDIRAALDALARAQPAAHATAHRPARRVRIRLDEDGHVAAAATALENGIGSGSGPGSAAPPRSAATPGSVPAGLPRVVLDSDPIDSADRFLFHKTTRREPYDRRLAAAPAGTFDVLLRNERDEITEFTRGNVVVEIDGRLVTPPLDAGLLPGCLRAELLDEGVITEAAILVEDVRRAARVWLVNSVRGWVEVDVEGRR